MPPSIRNFTLTAHVTSSVGWIGAVACFLALALVGLSSHDPEMIRAAYLAMELIGWCVIVPLSLASPLTGLIQSLGTPWGLFRHYWVAAKVSITIPCTIILLLHMKPTARLANAMAETVLSNPELGGLRIQLVADAGAAVVALLIATALAVYKPVGVIRAGMPRWVKVFAGLAIFLLLTFIVLHLTGNSPAHGPHF